ncbi:succinate dehydrogenase assembly factor 2 [Pelagibacteraceae bacterium]|jgi:antitoxin CptB|nr:succinate dehydrogenase assembly factor 2 [Pelagibacteraceae bacterium]
MTNKLENLKKRIIYRASYRGTKEMDILLTNFVNKYIDDFDENLLIELEKFLNYEDDLIINYYHHDIIKEKIDVNKVSKLFKNFKF